MPTACYRGFFPRAALVFSTSLLLTLALGMGGFIHGEDARGATAQSAEEIRWPAELRALFEGDAFYQYAVKLLGSPSAYNGELTEEYGEIIFGNITFFFAKAATLTVEILPPESVIAKLRIPEGFPDEAEAKAVLKRYTEENGVKVDWSKPEEESTGDERILRFWDPDTGLNAAASLVYAGDKLVEIGFSMAL